MSQSRKMTPGVFPSLRPPHPQRCTETSLLKVWSKSRAPAACGSWLEMQNFRPLPGPPNQNLHFSKNSDNLQALYSWRNTALEKFFPLRVMQLPVGRRGYLPTSAGSTPNAGHSDARRRSVLQGHTGVTRVALSSKTLPSSPTTSPLCQPASAPPALHCTGQLERR